MKLRIGVVIPVLSSFKEAIIALSRIRTKHIWTPYIAPQWVQNRAISRAWNVYSTEAFEDGCDYVIIMNDDAWPFPKSFDALVKEAEKTGTLLVSGASTQNERDSLLDLPFKRVNLDFSFFIIAPTIFDEAGFFDENFYPAYFEDNDFHWRLQLLGIPAYGVSTGLYYHEGATTYKREAGPRKLAAHFNANRAYYIRKWGGIPGQERFVTPFNKGGSVKEWELE